MIYTDAQLKEKIAVLIDSFENEVVEFKEARSNFSFNDMGKYFSALSKYAWFVGGMADFWDIRQ